MTTLDYSTVPCDLKYWDTKNKNWLLMVTNPFRSESVGLENDYRPHQVRNRKIYENKLFKIIEMDF